MKKKANIKIQRRVKQFRFVSSICIDYLSNGRALPSRQNRLSVGGLGLVLAEWKIAYV